MVLDKIRSAFKKSEDRGELKIQASLASSNMVLFTLSEAIIDQDKVLCQSEKQAVGSPLLEKLFSVNGVEEVFVNRDAMRVKFSAGADLKEGAKSIGALTRELWTSGSDLIPSSYIWANAPTKEEDVFVSEAAQSAIGQQVKKVLDETVAPGLASHGGHVTLVDIKDGYIHLNFGGGCQGCSQVSTTVKDGVEKVILQHFPEFKGVMDVTNHAGGENPYYR